MFTLCYSVSKLYSLKFLCFIILASSGVSLIVGSRRHVVRCLEHAPRRALVACSLGIGARGTSFECSFAGHKSPLVFCMSFVALPGLQTPEVAGQAGRDTQGEPACSRARGMGAGRREGGELGCGEGMGVVVLGAWCSGAW